MSHCWQKTLISESSTIKQALEIINSEALRVAVVVDQDKKLLGMITDGDIRRGLLNDLVLTDSVAKVMNSEPITAEQGASKEHLVELMEKKQILSVPLLDQDNKVVGLETLHSALSKDKYQNPVFIMAGGFGTRLRPLTDNCPKPMLKVGDKPILETVIKSFIRAGFNNFYISTHYMPEQIHHHFGDGTDLGVSISYVHEETPLGTGGALGLLPEDMPRDLPLIMINGDVLTKVDFGRLLNFHMENDADATMCVREYDYQIPYGVINGDGNQITSMVEKPVQRFFVNAGIYVVSPRVIQSVEKNQKIDMPTLLEQHMEERQKVLMFPIHEYWLDIGRMDDFNRAQMDILSLGLEQC
ncbi:nucleotidyltransferase family protein [Vibrio parahaemolyticus]|uniref:nucleotidyltransferase family protein n=1 Tax=Vibrio parahaemolyticus TaxID=670 RepID=UPI000417E859|nr:nucleotidyltransferase family protein [Vibrio parahaemolyticus]MDF4800899.1 nucleotidyltransferase family protein [Vibrio parahaemolyticus]MDF4807526.1 nucleotidyltransferase family protein [Vibrio parahaemolyticus]MDF4851643.1 nucleotidyltransferase family protein [Vibrio parahaemolyticus]TPA16155.1 CBS domain-containing protein [Vibrio parahaemolyticus]HBI3713373.1 nucleotidyltransferase family protein [Vibrio parahaemolyticus]